MSNVTSWSIGLFPKYKTKSVLTAILSNYHFIDHLKDLTDIMLKLKNIMCTVFLCILQDNVSKAWFCSVAERLLMY